MTNEPHELDTEFQQPWQELPQDDEPLGDWPAAVAWLLLSAVSSLLAIAFGAWLYTLIK